MIRKFILPAVLLAASTQISASIIVPGSWSVMGQEDQTSYNLGPGVGGQYFDAEYLLYNFNESTNVLSLALQTGFDILDNHQQFSTRNFNTASGAHYWGGDLALSFDGSTSGALNGYEYAIDFGMATGNYNDRSSGNASLGTDNAGLYQVNNWDNNIAFPASSPFAMASGVEKIASANISWGQGFATNSGFGTTRNGVTNEVSYYRTMSFDLDDIAGLNVNDISQIDAHWTMSCGNDEIVGHADVPEPAVIWLMISGMLGLMGSAAVRRKAKHS